MLRHIHKTHFFSVLGTPHNNKKGLLLIFKHSFLILYAYARTSKRERMSVKLPYNTIFLDFFKNKSKFR